MLEHFYESCKCDQYGFSKRIHCYRYGEFLKTNEVTYFEVVAARNRCSNAYFRLNSGYCKMLMFQRKGLIAALEPLSN